MFRKVILIIVIIGVAITVSAQEPGEALNIGIQEVFHSDILDEDRNIHIFLPYGYSRIDYKFPVLYMLYNGEPDYHFNTGTAAAMSRMRLIPPMITVAFDMGDARRDLTPTASEDYGPTSGGADNFLKFIKDELIPYIDKNYRTAPHRLFSSHSIGALFGLYALLKEPDVFQSVLLSSPWMVYDGDRKYILKNTESFLSARNNQTNFLYICVGDENNLLPEIEAFISILEKNKPEGMKWKYVKMPDENHTTILTRSMVEGLKAFGSNR